MSMNPNVHRDPEDYRDYSIIRPILPKNFVRHVLAINTPTLQPVEQYQVEQYQKSLPALEDMGRGAIGDYRLPLPGEITEA